MFTRPTVKQHFQIVSLASDEVYLLSERVQTVLRGAPFGTVVPLLDGRRTVEEIVEQAAPRLDAPQVMYALLELESRGYLTESPDGTPADHAAFWHARDVDASAATQRLFDTTISVRNIGSTSTDACTDTLSRHGLRLTEDGDVVVVLADHYLQSGLDDLNRGFLESGRPWVLIKPGGTVAWIGPMFDPTTTGCWRCLEHPLRGNHPVADLIKVKTGAADPPNVFRGALPASVDAALAILGMYLVTSIGSGGDGHLSGTITTLDSTNGTLERHRLRRRPQCPACGDPDLYGRLVREPVVLAAQRKRYTDDGGYRVAYPEETVRRFDECVSDITGVVRDVRKATLRGRSPVHLYVASHGGPALAHPRAVLLGIAGHQGAGGKGKTDLQARASVLGEAIERASGVFQGDEPRIRDSFAALGDDAIHPNACMLFSKAQYDGRGAMDPTQPAFNMVPVPFDERAKLDWTPVWSMTERRHRYLPTMHLYYAYPAPADQIFCPSDSNGNACGNTREEAILQGFFELVERDAVGAWWYNRARRPAVDLDSVRDRYLDDLREYYHSLGRELWVLDLTSDLNIPVYASVSRVVDGRAEEILMGFGAHFDAEIALGRAVTELSQMLAYGTGADRTGDTFHPQIRDWLETAAVERHPYLSPKPGAPSRLDDYPSDARPDLRDDIDEAQRRVERAGLEMLVLDQTRPDLSIPVVKVIVPGLRHFWARFAPGRLYDIPVQTGWIPAGLTEDELNPIPMFF